MGSDGMTQEQTAFLRQLYMDYADKLAQNAFRHTGDEELAADLVQEVFVTAIMRIEDVYKLSANPRPWLYKVLNNLMRRELAKAHHTREIPISEETQLGAVELEVPLRALLPIGLSEKEKEFLIWRLELHMSYAEIAEQRGMSEAAYRQYVNRIMEKCQRLLEDESIARS